MTTRASVVPIEEVFHPGDFETQNDLYIEHRAREPASTWRGARSPPPGSTPRDVGPAS